MYMSVCACEHACMWVIFKLDFWALASAVLHSFVQVCHVHEVLLDTLPSLLCVYRYGHDRSEHLAFCIYHWIAFSRFASAR